MARSTFRSQDAKSTSSADYFWKLSCGKGESRCGAKPVVARSTLGSQNVQSTPCSEHLWKLRCSKSGRQNVQNTPCSEHLWKLRCSKGARADGAQSTCRTQNVQCTQHLSLGALLKFRCRKSARRCGAKHISESKALKTNRLGALWEVEMLKKYTSLWCEAHFEVKSVKLTVLDHFWTLRCRFAWPAQGIVHPAQSEQNVTVLSHFQNRWRAWDI